MPAPIYATTLRGLGIDLLVANILTFMSFAEMIFGGPCFYSDPDFAILRLGGME